MKCTDDFELEHNLDMARYLTTCAYRAALSDSSNEDMVNEVVHAGFTIAIMLLMERGMSERKAKKFIGKLYGPE